MIPSGSATIAGPSAGPVAAHGAGAGVLAITGIGVVAPPRPGADEFAAAFAAAPPTTAPSEDPEQSPYVLADFDVRAHLSRRGTSTLDRATSLALVACVEALAEPGPDPDDEHRHFGVSLGTTAGSLRSMSEYTVQTLTEERPYLVNPSLFPNTVMNCAAGQAAIRHGLRGINATIAGGDIALFAVLRGAARAIALGQLDAVLAGAVEEFSPQRAWQAQLARRQGPAVAAGEGAAIFRLERAADVHASGREPIASIDAVTSGFSPGGECSTLPAALAGCIARALARAGAARSDVSIIGCRVPTDTILPAGGREAARIALGTTPARWLSVEGVAGDCGAATSALQLAAVIAQRRSSPARASECALLFGWTRDGGLGAAVIRTREDR